MQRVVVKMYFIKMNVERMENQLHDLKKQITDLGISIPGSIQTVYLRCGKKNCRCHQVVDTEDLRHGPYYLWYRRINGKTATKSIAEEDLKSYQGWIENREKLESLVQKIISLGVDYAALFKSTPDKFKNNSTSKRGK